MEFLFFFYTIKHCLLACYFFMVFSSSFLSYSKKQSLKQLDRFFLFCLCFFLVLLHALQISHCFFRIYILILLVALIIRLQPLSFTSLSIYLSHSLCLSLCLSIYPQPSLSPLETPVSCEENL